MSDDFMTIGELSERSGVSVKKIRRYTNRGLIFGAGRSKGNYRLYDESALECIRGVMALRSLGLSLKDIEQLNALYTDDAYRPVGPWLLKRLAQVRTEIDQQINQLESIRARIDDFMAKHADQLRRDALAELTQEFATSNDPHERVRSYMETR